MHILHKSKILFEMSFLVKLNIACFKEMGFYLQISLNEIFIDSPFGNPFTCIELGDADIFRCQTNVDIQTLFIYLSQNFVIKRVPWDAFGVLKYF